MSEANPLLAIHVNGSSDIIIASEASFLVCSTHGFSIYISVSGRTSCRKCSKCFYVYLNIRPVRYSARIESVISNAKRQRIAAQSPKERDARLQQVTTAREQTIATESTEERQTRLQQLRSAQQQRIAAEPQEDRGPFSTLKNCLTTGLLTNRQRRERPVLNS